MHLYVAAKGQYRWLWDWVAALSARYYPYKIDDGPKRAVQLSVRPIQLFEIVFPEPCLKEVLSIVWPYNLQNTRSFQGEAFKKMLRIGGIVGLKKVPYVKKGPAYEMVNPHGFVGVTGIGLKKDTYHPKTGYEML